ncbi:MAG: hypothetical protein ACI9BS_001745 [Candidatus Poriferisodalaceae bacterium]|jgi:hypothetical protein
MSSDELDGFDREEFEDGFGSLERSLKFVVWVQQMMPIRPKDDVEMLSKVLAGRAVVKLLGKGLFGTDHQHVADRLLKELEAQVSCAHEKNDSELPKSGVWL